MGHMDKPLDEWADDIVEDGIVDAAEVAQMRERLLAAGGVDREAADFLFTINDAVSGAENDPGWRALFVEALTKHVLEDEVSPGEVDEDEADYLIEMIEGDAQVDETELALLVNIVAEAKSTPDSLQEFTLGALKDAILEDGIIDAAEVVMLRKVLYGSGSGGGAGVDTAEAELLFELNDAVSGKANDPSWGVFFAEAIAKHVLEDEVSPGTIDEDEAEWLIERIEGDRQVDDVEKGLLAALKGKPMPDRLKAKLDEWGV